MSLISDYKIVPWAKDYCVSKHGIVLNTVNRYILPQTCIRGYYYVELIVPGETQERYFRKNINGEMITTNVRKGKVRISTHRLVAMLWVDNPDPENKTYVNHIDGDPANNQWNNLEWVTAAENNIHAHENETYMRHMHVRVRDYYTKEEYYFDNIAKAKEFMGVPSNTLTSNLCPIKFGVLIADKYEVRFAYDDRPWFYENRERIKPTRYIVIVTHPDGKEEELYDIDTIIARFDKLPSRRTLQVIPEIVDRLIRDYPEYHFRYRDARQEDIYERSRARRRKENQKIVLLDIVNKKTYLFNTTIDLARAVGRTPKILRHYISDNNPYRINGVDRYHFIKLTDKERLKLLLDYYGMSEPDLSSGDASNNKPL